MRQGLTSRTGRDQAGWRTFDDTTHAPTTPERPRRRRLRALVPAARQRAAATENLKCLVSRGHGWPSSRRRGVGTAGLFTSCHVADSKGSRLRLTGRPTLKNAELALAGR